MRASHVLLVDDEVRFVHNLAKLLERHGFSVHTAFEGGQALDLISKKESIEVVVLDVRMPGMDGIQTLRSIKQSHPDLEVIMLTGDASLDDGIEAVRAGAFDYLQKPCDIEDLIARVKAACNVERIRRHPVLWPRTMVGEVMLSGFLPLFPEDGLGRALSIFNRYRDDQGGHMLFVVDQGRRLRGTITRRDLLDVCTKTPQPPATWEWLRRHPEALPDGPIERIMNPEVTAVSPQTPLAEAAEQMLSHRCDSLPVVEEGCVQGVVRLADVLRYMQTEDDDKR